MESSDNKKFSTSSYKLYCLTKCFQNKPEMELEEKKLSSDQVIISSKSKDKKQPGGWRAMPYILGNETFERLATFGLLANFMVYLTREFRMEQAAAANIINIWSGLTNFAPLLGAFLSDAYLGRFTTIAFASCACLLGMVTVTLTAWIPDLHPQCHHGSCEKATSAQLGVLLMGLGLLSTGTGGIRPCSIPFGVDQFDPSTEEGVKGINSFYNWYYTSFTVVILITLTVVVYIQDSISWVVGFGIPTGLMLCSIILFFFGTKIYVHVKAQGSIFSGLAQVFVAAYRKRGIKLPDDIDASIFYNPPVEDTSQLSKLPLTNHYRFLNKGAVIQKNDIKADGWCANPWKLCSVQQVEEVKSLFKMGPVWASGIICFTAITQQGTFTVSQALKMNRHLGHSFQIPAGSIGVFSMITVGLWLPFYDRVLVPSLRKITNREGGITLLQRIGIGILFSILSMLIAGLVEKDRRVRAIANPGSTMSVMWLVPQLVTMGFCEAFACIGHIELYNREFPDHMRSIANSLFFCSFAGANYLSSFIITIVQKVTRTRDHPDWLANDLNAGKLDYFYFLLAGLGVLNLFYFLFCSYHYHYKAAASIVQDVELSLSKKVVST